MSIDEEAKLATLAIEVIAKVIEAVRSAKSGKTDPAVAIQAIQDLHAGLAATNAAADAELAAKFDVSER